MSDREDTESNQELARIVIEWDNSERSIPSLMVDIRQALGDDAEVLHVKTTRDCDV